MKHRRLFVLLLAVPLLAAEPAVPNRPLQPSPFFQEAETENPVQLTLVVQSTMQQGREALKKKDYRTAVRLLESQLPRANGSGIYLLLLEDAYRGYVRELKKDGNEELAQRYLERLAILDPGATLTGKGPAKKPADPPQFHVAPGSAPVVPGRDVGMTIRGHADDDPQARLTSPANQQIAQASSEAAAQFAQGDKEFQARRYVEAAGCYHRAYGLDSNLPPEGKDRWAYCKLYWVTEQINNADVKPPDWSVLRQQVLSAQTLSPRLEHGKNLLKIIEERARPARPESSKGVPPTTVRHLAQKQRGWQVAESPSFRVFHNDAKLAEQVLQVAEQTRVVVARKWFGEDPPEDWTGRCDIYLHASGEAYGRATGVSPQSPGHSSIGADRNDAARIHSRQIDLHVDDPNMVVAVLPHETTHVVIAGRFGPQPLPRWADEGMAVLTEPDEKVQKHLRNLPQAYRDGRVFSAGQLMQMDDYPQPHLIGSFYAQSVSLVQYLTELKGPRIFSEFLRDAQRMGYEAALRRHYDLRGFSELEQRWSRIAASGESGRPAMAAQGGK